MSSGHCAKAPQTTWPKRLSSRSGGQQGGSPEAPREGPSRASPRVRRLLVILMNLCVIVTWPLPRASVSKLPSQRTAAIGPGPTESGRPHLKALIPLHRCGLSEAPGGYELGDTIPPRWTWGCGEMRSQWWAVCGGSSAAAGLLGSWWGGHRTGPHLPAAAPH